MTLLREIIYRLPWNILGPLTFLMVCMPLVYVCPDEDKGKLIFLIVGAALTRVKISAPNENLPPQLPPTPALPADPPPAKE